MTGFYFLRRHICKILIRENRIRPIVGPSGKSGPSARGEKRPAGLKIFNLCGFAKTKREDR